jgi:hypothetical protein
VPIGRGNHRRIQQEHYRAHFEQAIRTVEKIVGTLRKAELASKIFYLLENNPKLLEEFDCGNFLAGICKSKMTIAFQRMQPFLRYISPISLSRHLLGCQQVAFIGYIKIAGCVFGLDLPCPSQ